MGASERYRGVGARDLFLRKHRYLSSLPSACVPSTGLLQTPAIPGLASSGQPISSPKLAHFIIFIAPGLASAWRLQH